MGAMRHPILIWPNPAGGLTGAIAGDAEGAAAQAATESELLQQLKDLLEWRMEHQPWNADPDFTHPQLLEVKVDVLPQYLERTRVIPCPETVRLKVPCVIGVQENGLRVCAVPHLGLRFNYQDPDSLPALVAHYVKESLQGLSPLLLTRYLPPRECRLSEIVTRTATGAAKVIPPRSRPELKPLFAVADPLLQDRRRKRGPSAAYGRESLSVELANKLAGEKSNVLLVGETGVGKSTLLFDAAKRVFRETPAASTDAGGAEPNSLRGYRLWRGNGSRLIAGMRYLGEWEERCEEFINHLQAIAGVFCAENLLELLQVGGEGPGQSVAAFLLPYLQRGELRIVAEATPAEVEACRRLLPGLLDVFQVLPVPEFNPAEATDVLARIARACLGPARAQPDPSAVPLVYRLFKRFLPYSAFPGAAADFVRELCDHSKRRDAGPEQALTPADVVTQFIRRTGLPETFLRDELPLPLEEVRRSFDAQIIGQPDATLTMARLVTTIKAGLTDPTRPLGVLLFCGPTGVGKTALARATASFCFGALGQKDRLVRLDMSEYSGWGAAARLLHAPNGAAAPWIEQVRRQPFCLVLLDEIEKAAPEVFDVLLGLLDEGRLTDRFGRVTHFRSAIIILTSNLGSDTVGPAGFISREGPAYENEVGKFFRPEFFNRLDAVVTFKPLSPAEVEAITRKELNDLAQREGFVAAGLRLECSDALVGLLAREGYDHRLGARPLQRALERLLVTPLARWKVAHPGIRNAGLQIDLDREGRVRVRAVA